MKKSDAILIVMFLWISVGAICALFKVSFKEYGFYWVAVAIIIMISEFIVLCKERKGDKDEII